MEKNDAMNTLIRLWIADIESLGADKQLDRLMTILPETVREKAFRFVRREDRLRFTVGKLMIRALAAKERGDPNAPIRLSEYGKPYFAWEKAPHFNLSHSGRLIVLASANIPLGVDVEERSVIDWRKLAFVFSEDEKATLELSDHPLECFYRFWTVREAFSKEEGIGLSIYENDGIVVDYVLETIHFQEKTLYFRTWEFPEYTLSLCTGQPVNVHVHTRWLSITDWKNVLTLNGCKNTACFIR